MTTLTKPQTRSDARPLTAEQADWRLHFATVRRLPQAVAGYRGCFGLAMVLTSQNTDDWHTYATGPNESSAFVDNDKIAWASLVDVPVGYFHLPGVSREVHWGAVRKAEVKFGMPTLAGEESHAFDFRAEPGVGDGEPQFSGATAVLRPDDDRQLFRVFNALNWAMTTTAFSRRPEWMPYADALKPAFDADPTGLLAFGGGMYEYAAKPHAWMPEAYLPFSPTTFPGLFDAAVRTAECAFGSPRYDRELQAAFALAVGENLAYRAKFDGRVAEVLLGYYRDVPCVEYRLTGDHGEKEVVRFFRRTCRKRKGRGDRFKAGQVIAEEAFDRGVPDNWYARSERDKWISVCHMLSDRLHPVLRLWFERQRERLTADLYHMPSKLISPAAYHRTADGPLYWEINRALDYYDNGCDAVVFPTVEMRTWYSLSDVLPGDVMYDLTPRDTRFESRSDQLRRVQERRSRQSADRRDAAFSAG